MGLLHFQNSSSEGPIVIPFFSSSSSSSLSQGGTAPVWTFPVCLVLKCGAEDCWVTDDSPDVLFVDYKIMLYVFTNF